MTRRTKASFAIVLVAFAVLALPPIRASVLRAVGWTLVDEDPVGRADVIVLSVDVGVAGLLEAADLVQHGVAPVVAVFSGPPDELERELIRRGAPYEDSAVRTRRELAALGVPRVEAIDLSVAGTQDESRALPPWLEEHALKSAIFVVTADHSRRVRRVMHRAMSGRPIQLTIRYARRSRFDPDRWWQSRTGLRTGIVELEKLALDVILHPLS